jgi:hypothetical protein
MLGLVGRASRFRRVVVIVRPAVVGAFRNIVVNFVFDRVFPDPFFDGEGS